jgi:hypothetical protein
MISSTFGNHSRTYRSKWPLSDHKQTILTFSVLTSREEGQDLEEPGLLLQGSYVNRVQQAALGETIPTIPCLAGGGGATVMP